MFGRVVIVKRLPLRAAEIGGRGVGQKSSTSLKPQKRSFKTLGEPLRPIVASLRRALSFSNWLLWKSSFLISAW